MEPDDQRRGHLFGRLMMDVFHALGYHEFLLNTPKSGREIDLRGQHRTAGHSVIAECKATADPIGGADLNKFAGALELEREARKEPIDAYFISLGGFRTSALEQESELSKPRMVLMTGQDVVRELIAGKIVVAPEVASAAAATCLPTGMRVGASPSLEMLAHPSGWCWSVVFSAKGSPTAVAFVHADGTPLEEKAAAPLMLGDAATTGIFAALELLTPHDVPTPAINELAAREAYQAFLGREYGRITVDGLPADEHLESKSIALNDLFVPMHLQASKSTKQPSPPTRAPDDAVTSRHPSPPFDDDLLDPDVDVESPREPVGEVLAREKRIAILGQPGSGKSTLLKRLAVAYGVPGMRLVEIADRLPERNWFPFVVRCRQLEDLASHTFHDVLRSIPTQAEMPEHADAFTSITDAALRDGSALILIDGLDEIADPKVRLTFVKQLRTFIGTYPNVQLVVTSREAGFRVVAGALCDVSASFRVADFDDADIQQLTVAWTVLMVSDSPETRNEAVEISQTIIGTDRVRRLARNPLLLTTLLLVRRWVGDLPKKRTALYAKAIEVLLMTWNIEGHTPIDLDDAIPQLAYVAFVMTRDGTQILSRPALISVLDDARNQMPEVLGHTPIAPGQFLERIEDRSSLLSLSGHALENGVFVALYEFKHLTFQEYLAAVAIADGYYPDRDATDTAERVILPLIQRQQWYEVIPMAAVLAGRRATPVINALIQAAKESGSKSLQSRQGLIRQDAAVTLLARCLGDEVQMPPSTVADAARTLALAQWGTVEETAQTIMTSKYAVTFRQALLESFLSGREHYWDYAALFSFIVRHSHLSMQSEWKPRELVDVIEKLLDPAGSSEVRAEGGLVAMHLLFESHTPSARRYLRGGLSSGALYRLERALRSNLDTDDAALRYAVMWAYAWLGYHTLDGRRFVPHVLPTFYRAWKSGRAIDLRRHAAWVFASQPLIPRAAVPLGARSERDEEFIAKEMNSRRSPGWRREDRRPAAAVASYYFGKPYSGHLLREKVTQLPANLTARRRLLRRRL